MAVPEADLALVANFCADSSPEEHAGEIRVEYTVTGSTVEIVEVSRLGAQRDEDWLRVPSARLKYVAADKLWTLFCFDRDSRAVRYETWNPDFVQPATIQRILAEIEADPTNIFWG